MPPYTDLHELNLDTPMGRELTQYLGPEQCAALKARVERAAQARNIDLLPQHQDAFLCLLMAFMQMADEA